MQGSLWLIEFARRLPSVIRHPAVWAERKKRTGREANVLVSAIQSGAKFNLRVSGFCSHSTTCSDMFKMLLTHQQGGHRARTKAACFCFILCKTWLNISLGFFLFLLHLRFQIADEDRTAVSAPNVISKIGFHNVSLPASIPQISPAQKISVGPKYSALEL